MAGQMTREQGFNHWRIAGWGLALALLLAPLVAMQFTAEVDWAAPDFAVAALLIGGVGLGLELAVRKTRSAPFRAATMLAVLTALLLIWVNLAVGFIGDEDNPANLMFAGVLLIAMAGALLGRFRPRGMAIASAAAGGAQLLVAVIVFVADLGSPPELLLTIAFAAPWAFAAALYRRAAAAEERA